MGNITGLASTQTLDVRGGASPTGTQVSIVKEGAPGPGEAFVALQRSRLRAAAALLAVLTNLLAALFLAAGNAVWPFHGCAALCIWAAFAWLSSNRGSRGALRIAEYGGFGVMTADLVAGQYLLMLRTATRGVPLNFENVVDTTFAGSILLRFAYAMVIPNTWRAAIGPVGLIVLGPTLAVLILYGQYPEVLLFAIERGVPVFGSRVLFLDLAAAGLAVYGAHVLGTLRQEVFESRRLNQYRLRERLGAGGMGEVHLAEHRLLPRLCAVKLIRPEAAGDRRAPDFDEAAAAGLREAVRADDGATLEDLAEAAGVACSAPAVYRALGRLGITREKNRGGRPSRAAPS